MSAHGKSPRDRTMRVTVAQIDCALGDIAGNLERAARVLEQAREERSDLIVFPELSLTGYSLAQVAEDISLDAIDETFGPLLEGRNGLSAVVGFSEAGRLHTYNSAAYLRDGQLLHVHRKLYLPNYGMYEERKHFSPGQALRAFETPFGMAAILICNDLWQPMLPFLAVQDGAQLLLVPANSSRNAFPGLADMQPEWQAINRFHARMLESFLIFVNRVGREADLSFWGGSQVLDPWGEVIFQAPLDEPTVATVELDLNKVRERRRAMPLVKEARLALLAREIERLAAEGGDL
jgi:N-carbamoylputrescine amidase